MWYRTLKTLGLVIMATVSGAAVAEAQTNSPAGTYTLTQVGDAQLPFVVEEEGDCREELVSATLTLTTDGEWELEGAVRETCGTNVETDTDTEEGEYTVEGADIRFGNLDEEGDDDEEIDWEDLSLGRFDGGLLVVALEEGETTLVFRR